MIDHTDGRLIGTSRFEHHDPARREVEIGWTFLARSHWGRHYNQQMKQLMLAHAFEVVDAVVFKVHNENRRSQRAVEKLGATLIGTEPDAHGWGQIYVFRLQSPKPAVPQD